MSLVSQVDDSSQRFAYKDGADRDISSTPYHRREAQSRHMARHVKCVAFSWIILHWLVTQAYISRNLDTCPTLEELSLPFCTCMSVPLHHAYAGVVIPDLEDGCLGDTQMNVALKLCTISSQVDPVILNKEFNASVRLHNIL